MPRAERARRWLPRAWREVGAEAALVAEQARIEARANKPKRTGTKQLEAAQRPHENAAAVLERLRAWFRHRGWSPFAFQEETWAAYAAGESGLIHVPTGAGKTYAAFFGPLADVVAGGQTGLQIVYVTPLRAVSRDLELALRAPVEGIDVDVTVASRTGDTEAAARSRQRARPPNVLLTTPESLSLLLTQDEAATTFAGLRAVIVDEWHELLGTKRGTQLELALARLRQLAPALRTWALSATIANIDEAARAATGVSASPFIVTARMMRPVEIETLLPDGVDAFPFAGSMGMAMLPRVIEALAEEGSSLVFTNTRSQAERWFRAIEAARPGWAGQIALHHGSLDAVERSRVEGALKDGTLRVVVATSSLDLGVDFAPVERVVQIGSPKAVARLVQRAGRAAHRPGAACRLLFVPMSALELFEIAAARDAIAAGAYESRVVAKKPLDVLAQHMVTCALGGGFEATALFDEVRGTVAYAGLDRSEFDWVLALVRDGGRALGAYADYQRVVAVDGRYVVRNPRVARLHRMSVGTIVSEALVRIRMFRGEALGVVEEAFVARLRPNDRFVFAGRALEFVGLRDMTALVRPARGPVTQTPLWRGGRMPFSPVLSAALRNLFARLATGDVEGAEVRAAGPLLCAQARISRLPSTRDVVAELCRTREGFHLFLFPLEGRLVHEGLAALLALRLARRRPATFSLAANDYGLELVCRAAYDFEAALMPSLFATDTLDADAAESANVAELTRRQFREVARVAGLVFQGYPGANKSARQVQASSSLLYEVFSRYDPGNLLVAQARREVLDQQFERARLEATLARLASSPLRVSRLSRPSPFAFPLLVERAAATLSTESLLDRIERMKATWAT